MWRADSFEKTLMLGKIEGRGERGNRGWDGWMASPTWWTWVWADSGSLWWTGGPGMLRFVGLQRVGHDRLNWIECELVTWMLSKHPQLPLSPLPWPHQPLIQDLLYCSHNQLLKCGSLTQGVTKMLFQHHGRKPCKILPLPPIPALKVAAVLVARGYRPSSRSFRVRPQWIPSLLHCQLWALWASSVKGVKNTYIKTL